MQAAMRNTVLHAPKVGCKIRKVLKYILKCKQIVSYIFMNDDSSKLWCSKSCHICRSICNSHQSSGKFWTQLHMIYLLKKNCKSEYINFELIEYAILLGTLDVLKSKGTIFMTQGKVDFGLWGILSCIIKFFYYRMFFYCYEVNSHIAYVND